MEKEGRSDDSDDLEKLRREYNVYEKSVVGLIQTRLGSLSTFSKLLSDCRGVSSCAQTALDALKEVGEGVTVAEFEAAHPNYAWLALLPSISGDGRDEVDCPTYRRGISLRPTSSDTLQRRLRLALGKERMT